MKIIICGAGRVGQGIAARLASENNAVTVVDLSADLIRQITTDLDVRGIVGHGAYPDIMRQAGIESADMIICVTYSDEVNMIACQIAHSLFEVPTKVARVRAQAYLDNEWSDLYSRSNMPIDIIISPEVEIGKAILRRLNTPGAFDVVPFAEGLVKLIGVHIDEECPIINMPIRQIPDLFTDLHAVIVGVKRDGEIFAPDLNDPLNAGDDAYFIVKSAHVQRLLEILGTETEKARQVVIIGGGSVGTYVAQELETISGVKTRIIESDRIRAEETAEALKRTVVLHGDGMNAAVQEEAGVRNAEVVLCLTNDDKINLLSAALAKKLGANRSVSLINDVSMQGLKSELPIDMVIDPRATTVSSILRHVRRGRILDVYTLLDGQAEVIEGEVLDTSPLAGKTLEMLLLEEGISVGAVVQNNVVKYPDPKTVIRAGDTIVLLAEKNSTKQVEQMFRVSMEYF